MGRGPPEPCLQAPEMKEASEIGNAWAYYYYYCCCCITVFIIFREIQMDDWL
jgi:hypothetical protein